MLRPTHATCNPWTKVLQEPAPHVYSFFVDDEDRGDLDNTILVRPNELNIPWHTSFEASLQNEHWKPAESAAQDLLDRILRSKAEDKGVLPEHVKASTSPASQAKMNELLNTSVSISINVWPWASEKRIGLITQACMLLFLHDDVAESQLFSQLGNTIMDDALNDSTLDQLSNSSQWRNRIFAAYAKDVIDEDSETGPELLTSMVQYVELTRNKPPFTAKFESFTEYLAYRMVDVAHLFANVATKFACEIQLSDLELEPLATLNRIHGYHGAIANDLFSFAKEQRVATENGDALINGMSTLQNLLGVAPASAKTMICVYLWDMEDQLHAEYTRIVTGEKLNKSQARYARALVQSVAGNLFHMATLPRYAV